MFFTATNAVGSLYRYRPRRAITVWVHSPQLKRQYTVNGRLTAPCFEFVEDKQHADDRKRLSVIVDTLQSNRLFANDLLYCGFKGWPVITTGSFGKRNRTYAMDLPAIKRGIKYSWRNRHYNNTPFLHMDVAGGRLPTIAVFDPKCMAGGQFFGEENSRVPAYDYNAWWTRDGDNLDGHCVALFVFRHHAAKPDELEQTRR